MKFRHSLKMRVALVLILFVALAGCSSGGGDDSSSSGPNIQVSPSSHDFGTVTDNNTPSPLEVKINNTGNANLRVSSIALGNISNVQFDLDLNGGSDPCGGAFPKTISAGDSCTVEVAFLNHVIVGDFFADLEIDSNDANVVVDLSGAYASADTLALRINQVAKNCGTDVWTAYVSVIDQGGYPYTGLNWADFDVDVDNSFNLIDDLTTPSLTPSPIYLVAVLDYSASITRDPEIQSDMEEGLIALINAMGASDEVAIMKVDNLYEVVQDFTSNKTDLINAIEADWDNGDATMLYDAVGNAVKDVASKVGRRAVIVLTDGNDTGSTDYQTLISVINEANGSDGGVPIFPIALGSAWNQSALETMGDDTGGQLYVATASDNIRNVYIQLASLLFEEQYILSFDNPPEGGAGVLTVTADVENSPSDDKDITFCP